MNYDTSLWQKIVKEQEINKELEREKKLITVIDLLQKYFISRNVQEVYLINSLTKSHQFNQFSDIDIAVKGLLSKDYFSVFGDLEELLNTENIDLIEIEKCVFSDVIMTEGVRIK